MNGLRVIDLSTEIAGPYCSKLLADAGAEVVKVEEPGGDPLRRWSASHQDLPRGTDGALFRFLNQNKRGIELDLASEGGRRALLDLAATADLVIESFGAGGLAQRGLSFDQLGARQPGISLLSISPFGLTGPCAARPATEWTLQAAIGSTAYRGLPERGPVAAGGRIGEWIAGTYAAVGAIAAWRSARQTGRGQHVDLSMLECEVLSLTVYHDLNSQFAGGLLPQAIETPSIEPAKDGWIGFCTITGQQWKDFCAMIEAPELAKDERFFDATQRMQHLGLIHGTIHRWTRSHSVDEAIELASLLRIPCNPIGNGETLPRIDHFAERGVYVRSPHGFLQPRVPYQIHGVEQRAFGAAPKLGEHTEAVLAEAARVRPSTGPSAGTRRPQSPLPFAGLRVLDLTAFWAGPVAVATLADLGADVIKVESIQRPDGMRFAGAARKEPLWEWCPIYHGANTGKRAVTLRLDSERGAALVKRLIAKADIVIENFSARVLDHFGLGWETVRALNPRALLVRMPAFGLGGPWRDRPGFAMNIEQVSGLAWMTGYADMPLVVRGACDPVGGMHAIFALSAALEARDRSGHGYLVEVPLIEPALNLAAEQVIEHSAYGVLLSREGNRGPVGAPQGLYACREPGSWLALSVTNDAQWRALVSVLGNPAWAGDPALARADGRRRAHDRIDEELKRWCSECERDAAVAALSAAGIPTEAAINAHQLHPNPQLEHRGFFQWIDHPVTGRTRYPGLPMRFSGLPRALHRSPAPLLGQHNDEILRGELGLSDAEITELREEKITGERPAWM
jgi:crotonobetainyl-CoA:carnitine CoA-transferase CaiB-like acyl-CoA transferase